MRRRFLLAAASTLVAAVAAGSVYAFLIEHYHFAVIRQLRRPQLALSYLLSPKFRETIRLINAEYSQNTDDTFAIFELNAPYSLSRKLFRPVEMYGRTEYMHQPNVTRVLFALPVGSWLRYFEMVDTPELERKLAALGATDVHRNTYDGLGFRRVEPELTRNCDLRVLFVGDSFTDGVFMDDRDTFVNQYGRLARAGGLGVCPINSGVEGYSTLQEAYVFEHYHEQIGKPSVAILMHFANDVDEDHIDEVMDGTLKDLSAKWEENFGYLRKIKVLAAQRGMTLAIAAIPVRSQTADPSSRRHYQDILRRFCEQEHLRFVDILNVLDRYKLDEIYLPNDVHWTISGNRIVADYVFEQTKDLLVDNSRR